MDNRGPAEELTAGGDALAWRKQVNLPLVVRAWAQPEGEPVWYLPANAPRHLVRALFPDLPDGDASDLTFRRDALGKPLLAWRGAAAAWAEASGLVPDHLHISNTHDGGLHWIVAAYHPDLAGLGMDAVALARLRSPGKDAAYLHRFAARFMSPQEYAAFRAASESDTLDALCLRAAAHFSLMESASKACGTGLKIGVGMGRSTSLPKQSLGAQRVWPTVELMFEGEALPRLTALKAAHSEAFWSADADFLTSLVLLWRTLPHPFAP